MPLTKDSFTSLITPAVYHHFNAGRNAVPSLRSRLYNVQTSARAYEKGTSLGGMSVDAWNQYANSGKPGALDFDELYTQTYTHEEYPVRVTIKKNLAINDMYGEIARIARRVGISAEQHMETQAAKLLNNAFATDTWSDSTYLCSDSHPMSPHDSSSTQDNAGTSAISLQAIKDTRVAMMKFTDDRGNRLGVMPNELWVPVDIYDDVLEIIDASGKAGTANNDANSQQGRWTVIPWARLTDTNNWFMVDGMLRQEAVNWYEREAMQMMVVDETTTHIVYEFKLHYSYGVDDWRWIYGHSVT